MAGDFVPRMQYLVGVVGHGELVGSVVVDQVYAHYQEVNTDFQHPRGGIPNALREALMTTAPEAFQEIADQVLDGNAQGGMREAVEMIASRYSAWAPREFANLSLSSHPSVTDNGVVVYDRQPTQRRLTHDELAALDRIRNAVNPNHPYGSVTNGGRRYRG